MTVFLISCSFILIMADFLYCSLIILIFVFQRIYKLFYKDELPNPYEVTVYVTIGVAFAIAGVTVVLIPITVSSVLLSSAFLLVSAGLFALAGMAIKGVNHIQYTSGSRHERKEIHIFIVFWCLLFFLMLLAAIFREIGM